MLTEDYCDFETAKLLKEKGFNEPCLMCYTSDKKLGNYGHYNSYKNSDVFSLTAPTIQMAMKWLREKEWVICVIPLTFYCGGNVNSWGYNIWADDNLEVDEENTPKFTTYEQACESAIKYCLENLI